MMILSLSKKTIIWITYISIVLYSTNFWVQQNTLPYLIKKFGADALAFGHLQTLFAVLQLFGSPLYGRLGDLIGARLALILAFGSCLVSYLLLSVAGSISMLFVSRVPIILMHAMQGGQMVVTDLSPAEERVGALAKLGVAYAVGMVIGNAAGGVFTKLAGEQASALAAAAGTGVNLALVLFCIPPSVKRRPADKTEHTSDEEDNATGDGPRGRLADAGFLSQLLDVRKLAELLRCPDTRYLLGVKLLTGVPIGVLQSMFPIVAVSIFKVDAMRNGFIMAYIAVLSMLVQGVVLPFASRRQSDAAILRASVALLAVSYTLLAFVSELRGFCLVMLPMVLGLTSLNVVISSTLTKTVTAEDTGAILGVNMSINNVIRIVSPTLGGWMLARWGFASFGWLGGAMSVATLAYMALSNRAAPGDGSAAGR